MARLVVILPNGWTREFSLDRAEQTLGRDKRCDIAIDGEPKLSRQHLRITRLNNAVDVEDLGSSNGTYMRGQRIRRRRMGHGDVLTVGRTRLEFHLGARSQAAIPVPSGRRRAAGPDRQRARQSGRQQGPRPSGRHGQPSGNPRRAERRRRGEPLATSPVRRRGPGWLIALVLLLGGAAGAWFALRGDGSDAEPTADDPPGLLDGVSDSVDSALNRLDGDTGPAMADLQPLSLGQWLRLSDDVARTPGSLERTRQWAEMNQTYSVRVPARVVDVRAGRRGPLVADDPDTITVLFQMEPGPGAVGGALSRWRGRMHVLAPASRRPDFAPGSRWILTCRTTGDGPLKEGRGLAGPGELGRHVLTVVDTSAPPPDPGPDPDPLPDPPDPDPQPPIRPDPQPDPPVTVPDRDPPQRDLDPRPVPPDPADVAANRALEVEALVEGGNPSRALEVLARTDPAVLPSPARRYLEALRRRCEFELGMATPTSRGLQWVEVEQVGRRAEAVQTLGFGNGFGQFVVYQSDGGLLLIDPDRLGNPPYRLLSADEVAAENQRVFERARDAAFEAACPSLAIAAGAESDMARLERNIAAYQRRAESAQRRYDAQAAAAARIREAGGDLTPEAQSMLDHLQERVQEATAEVAAAGRELTTARSRRQAALAAADRERLMARQRPEPAMAIALAITARRHGLMDAAREWTAAALRSDPWYVETLALREDRHFAELLATVDRNDTRNAAALADQLMNRYPRAAFSQRLWALLDPDSGNRLPRLGELLAGDGPDLPTVRDLPEPVWRELQGAARDADRPGRPDLSLRHLREAADAVRAASDLLREASALEDLADAEQELEDRGVDRPTALTVALDHYLAADSCLRHAEALEIGSVRSHVQDQVDDGIERVRAAMPGLLARLRTARTAGN